MSVGRPKSDNPRGHMISVKLNEEEKEMLDRVVASWAKEAEELGSEVSASSVIRTLVRREARARGLERTAKKGAKK